MKSAPTNHSSERARIFILNETIIRTSPTLACEIGLNESMILLQLDFWISITNHYYDGRHWTYQSVRDMKRKAFPFWSIATINRAISKLLVEGYIIEGNYNTAKFDKTRWFTLDYDKLSTLESIAIRKVETQSPCHPAQNDTRANQNDTRANQNETTIPEITTEITTENIYDDFQKKSENEEPVVGDNYYLAIDSTLARLGIRNSPSALDSSLMRELRRANVPLDLVLCTMNKVCEHNNKSPTASKIRSFNYFKDAIWEAHRKLQSVEELDMRYKSAAENTKKRIEIAKKMTGAKMIEDCRLKNEH